MPLKTVSLVEILETFTTYKMSKLKSQRDKRLVVEDSKYTSHPLWNTLAKGNGRSKKVGLYDPKNEHDACGLGFIANIKGKRLTQLSRMVCIY